jgi:hypothetical protein
MIVAAMAEALGCVAVTDTEKDLAGSCSGAIIAVGGE